MRVHPNFNFSQLRAFVMVAKQGSFTQAAGALHTSQPALSAKIVQLEQAFGARLFDRNTRSVSLTRIARDILPAVEGILGEAESLFARIQDESLGIVGRVVVGALPSMAATILPPGVARFRAEHPGIVIAVRDALTERLIEMLREDRVDFVVGSAVLGDRSLEFIELLVDHMAVVFPRGHALGAMARPRLEQIVLFPLILMDQNSSVRRIVEDALRASRRIAQPVYEAAFMTTAIGMVRAGLGVTVLPSSALEMQGAPDLEHRKLVNRSLAQKIGILRRRGRSLSPAAEMFITFLLNTRSER